MKIPTPNFVVFYNGNKETKDVKKLWLSASFECARVYSDFEWTATMVNINSGHNDSLFEKCKPLYYYSEYIARVRSNLSRGLSKENAVSEDVNFAIKNNFLNGFFKLQKSEVLNMSLTEFNEEEFKRQTFNEGKEVGFQEKTIETAKNMLKLNVGTIEQISQVTQLSVEEIMKLKNHIDLYEI